jgi:hypothetical protein
MPKSENKKDGEMIPITIRIFLGQTEIKVDAKIEGKFRRLSFHFEAPSEQDRERVESDHHKKKLPIEKKSK